MLPELFYSPIDIISQLVMICPGIEGLQPRLLFGGEDVTSQETLIGRLSLIVLSLEFPIGYLFAPHMHHGLEEVGIEEFAAVVWV